MTYDMDQQLTLLIYLIMSQMPLFGIVSSDTSDPLYWLRMMLAVRPLHHTLYSTAC